MLRRFRSSFTEEGTAFLAVKIIRSICAGRTVRQLRLSVGTVPQGQDVGFNTDGTLFTMGTGDPNSVANFRGEGDP
jgi:hypothetical protein